jgi:acyl-CoA reductase-like NAD-dependent aldehyde dehydrogenase
MPSITSDSTTRQDTVSSELSIGGAPTTAERGRYFTTTETVTGEPIAHVAAACAANARRAVDAAAAALPEWVAVAR